MTVISAICDCESKIGTAFSVEWMGVSLLSIRATLDNSSVCNLMDGEEGRQRFPQEYSAALWCNISSRLPRCGGRLHLTSSKHVLALKDGSWHDKELSSKWWNWVKIACLSSSRVEPVQEQDPVYWISEPKSWTLDKISSVIIYFCPIFSQFSYSLLGGDEPRRVTSNEMLPPRPPLSVTAPAHYSRRPKLTSTQLTSERVKPSIPPEFTCLNVLLHTTMESSRLENCSF